MSDTEDQKIPRSEWKVDADGCLQLACQEFKEIPSELASRFGNSAKTLDFSFNEITSVGTALAGFSCLHTLVLDNNSLESSQPGLSSLAGTLRVLSVNNNNITDLDVFLDSLVSLKSLRQLSMLRNPACPSPYFGGDSEDYARHRLYVISKLPKLEFLDTTPVSARERSEAIRRGALLRVSKPTAVPEQDKTVGGEAGVADAGVGGGNNAADAIFGSQSGDELTGLSPDMAAPGQTGPARFGVCSYVYYGKQSEGNRFILNDDL